MTDWNAVSAFMANVVPWPASDEEAGFVNLHYSMPNPTFDPKKKASFTNKKWFLTGKFYRDVASLVGYAGWLLGRPLQFQDQWFCTSLQGKTKRNKANTKDLANRSVADALKLKSIWIDVDVGDDPKKYPDLQTAVMAIFQFIKTVGLPQPSAMVYSGGGVHVYWISKVDLDVKDWTVYASGLKSLLLTHGVLCDAGLTTDAARILRMPGTFNYKYDPPKPVTLAPLKLVPYDFPTDLGFLKQFAGTVTAPLAAPVVSIWADDAAAAAFAAAKMDPAFAALDPKEGLGKKESKLLDPSPIFEKCGFLSEALATGGKDYANPLWHLSVLCSTFMENGNAIAHEISKGHPSYSEVDTQAEYDRTLADRITNDRGYPGCATIEGNGCTSCATCPLRSQGKSPLHIRPDPTVTAAVSAAPFGAAPCIVPEGFELNADDIVCKVIEKTDDEGGTTRISIPLFQSVLSDFWLQKLPGEKLNFTTTVDLGCVEQVCIPMGEISGSNFKKFLGDKRVLINTNGKNYLEEYFLSTIGKLRALSAAQISVPFGWYQDQSGSIRGFVYDGHILMDDGTKRPCGHVDPNLGRAYTPKGTMAEWLLAANSTLDRQRPELTSIILIALASPLIAFTNHNAILWSACGSDSGAGKSSAAQIGMSVWGDPILTKGTETQTVNNITTYMKTVRNLPFYWDEIKATATHGVHPLDKICSVMMEADGGKEKGRNKDATRTEDPGQWQMMLSYTANPSLRAHIGATSTETTAQLMRMLEWKVAKVQGGPGHMMMADADDLISLTRNNYGVFGRVYAEHLACHHKQIKKNIKKLISSFERVLGSGTDERKWITGMACMVEAAKLGRTCGLNVNPAAIEKFMIDIYVENMANRNMLAPGGKISNGETVLSRYIGDRWSAERGCWTNYMQIVQGKPPKPVVVIKGPQQGPRNYQGKLEFRFAVETKLLVICEKDFLVWLKENGFTTSSIYFEFVSVYQMRQDRLKPMSGTQYDTGREPCLVFEIDPTTPLWGLLNQFNIADAPMSTFETEDTSAA